MTACGTGCVPAAATVWVLSGRVRACVQYGSINCDHTSDVVLSCIAGPSSSPTPSPIVLPGGASTGNAPVSTGVIAGAVVGGVLGAALIVGAVFLFLRLHPRAHKRQWDRSKGGSEAGAQAEGMPTSTAGNGSEDSNPAHAPAPQEHQPPRTHKSAPAAVHQRRPHPALPVMLMVDAMVAKQEVVDPAQLTFDPDTHGDAARGEEQPAASGDAAQAGEADIDVV